VVLDGLLGREDDGSDAFADPAYVRAFTAAVTAPVLLEHRLQAGDLI